MPGIGWRTKGWPAVLDSLGSLQTAGACQPVDRAIGTCRRGDSGGVFHRRSRGVVAEVRCCLDGARARHEVQAAASCSKALKHEKAKSRRAQRDDRCDATAGNGRAPQRVRCSLALSDALASTRTLAAIGVYRSRIGESEEKSPHPTENAEAPTSVRLLTQIVGYDERSNRVPWRRGRVVGKAVVPHRLAERRFLRARGVEMPCYFVHTAIALLERFWQTRPLVRSRQS